jgi:tetratricopeptide (TPR) repeat protein
VLNPKNDEAYFMRGLSKNFLKEYLGSVDDFNDAIKLNPGKGIYYKSRAVAYYNLKKFDNACADLKLLISLEPNEKLPDFCK